jgi:hypothetical protein
VADVSQKSRLNEKLPKKKSKKVELAAQFRIRLPLSSPSPQRRGFVNRFNVRPNRQTFNVPRYPVKTLGPNQSQGFWVSP